MHTVAEFRITFSRILDPDGTLVAPLPAFAQPAEAVIPLYRAILLTRRFDAKAVALQRTGRLGTYPSSLGQEAVGVGIAAAMGADDVLVPSYRETAAMLGRGVNLLELLLLWGGDERGNDFAGPRQDFPVSIPVGTHALHAAGAAYAFKLRGEKRAAVAVFGDGATSKGDVAEALNVAGAWRLPVVFVTIDNQWAISVPRARQTAAETLAQKAIAAGIPGLQVDGNDVIAVRAVVERALGAAREGEGPALIEALSYRLSDHTTADDASRYRPAEEVSRRWREEPAARLRHYLAEAGVWSKDDEERTIAEIDAEVEAAVAAYEATPARDPATIFDHLYAELPGPLRAQKATLAGGESDG